jgi:hypothetical protein
MKSAEDLIDAELPPRAFFTFKELEECGPYSAEWWAKRARNGAVRVIQATAGRQGSIKKVPRGEAVRTLARLIK